MAGIVVLVALAVAPAVAPARTTTAAAVTVPCSTASLVTAINNANAAGNATLQLTPNCTYSITAPAAAGDGLPVITGNIAILGSPKVVIYPNPAGSNPNVIIRRASGAPAFRIFEVAPGGTLTMKYVAVEFGSTAGLGGAILNNGTLNVQTSVLSGNTASNGGGFENAAGATALVTNSSLTNNQTTGVGGGGFINFGTATVAGTTISANSAPINGGGVNVQPGGVTTINGSKVTQNHSGSLGGGLSNLGTLNLTQTTVTLNSGSGGGGIATGNASVFLTLSSVVNNLPDNCNPPNTIPGCSN